MAERTLAQWLQRIEALHPSEIELGLERAQQVYSRLKPATIPVVITVAGTNGKGSTVECITRCALAAGKRVGTYTSPHLVRFNERMAVNGNMASDEQIVQAFEDIERAREDIPLTYFEFTTLAALALFRALELDVWVLEVGLGGRLDAVNIVNADVAVITAIGLDHQDWLGDTRDAIGIEKAGIMRTGRVAVCSDPNPPDSVARHAKEIDASFLQLGVDFDYDVNQERWVYQYKAKHSDIEPKIRIDNLPVPPGAVLANLAGALTALYETRLLPAESQLRDVMNNWCLRGRLQRLDRSVPWWLDVAHNAESAQLLAATLTESMAKEGLAKCIAVLGVLGDKPVDDVIGALSDVVTEWIVVGLDSPRALAPAELAEKVKQVSSAEVEVLESVAAGLAVAKARAKSGDCIVVTGSFHTVGPALSWLNA